MAPQAGSLRPQLIALVSTQGQGEPTLPPWNLLTAYRLGAGPEEWGTLVAFPTTGWVLSHCAASPIVTGCLVLSRLGYEPAEEGIPTLFIVGIPTDKSGYQGLCFLQTLGSPRQCQRHRQWSRRRIARFSNMWPVFLGMHIGCLPVPVRYH